MEQLRFHSINLHEIWYLSFFSVIIKICQHWRVLYLKICVICDNISLYSSQNEKCFKVPEKIKAPFMFSNSCFKNCAVYEIIVESDRPQIIQYGACALHAAYLRPNTHTHTHTHTICNFYCFSTATIVAGTRHTVTFICTLPLIY